VLFKYDVQNKAFSQRIVDEILKRTSSKKFPVELVRRSFLDSEQVGAAFERRYAQEDEFPDHNLGVTSYMEMLKVLTPLQRDFAKKVCRAFEKHLRLTLPRRCAELWTRKSGLLNARSPSTEAMRQCVEDVDRLQLDTTESVYVKHELEVRIAQKEKNIKLNN
jgi:hypothetical protein